MNEPCYRETRTFKFMAEHLASDIARIAYEYLWYNKPDYLWSKFYASRRAGNLGYDEFASMDHVQGFYGACEGGHIDMILPMSSWTDVRFNREAIECAIVSGDLDTVKLAIDEAAEWNEILYDESAYTNDAFCSDLTSKLYGTIFINLNCCLRMACSLGHHSLVGFFINHGATICTCGRPLSSHCG